MEPDETPEELYLSFLNGNRSYALGVLAKAPPWYVMMFSIYVPGIERIHLAQKLREEANDGTTDVETV